MDVFKGQNLLEFSDRFKTDEDCKKYLASVKSGIRYKCLKCNHTACQIRTDFARQCSLKINGEKSCFYLSFLLPIVFNYFGLNKIKSFHLKIVQLFSHLIFS